MKRVLITGGCGWVGRHFARRFLDDGCSVTVVDDLSTGLAPLEWAFKSAQDYNLFSYFCDVRDSAMYPDLNEFDLIVHCAAVVGGRLKIEGDPLAVATDLAIDSDFFNAAAHCKTKAKIVYFSSSAVYPIEFQRNDNYKIKLAEPLTNFDGSRIGRPDMTYGWSKLTGEYLAKQAVDRYGLDVVIYRPFSGYGEDQSFDYPFPSIIRRVVSGEDPITIWGSGDQCRDFIHIDDIVACVLQTMNELEPGEVLNLGTGIPISFRQFAAMAHTESGAPTSPCNIVTDATKPEGVFYRVADTYKMNQFYKPKISLEEGIRRVADFIRRKAD